MWIATGFGFLMPAIRPPKTIKHGDTRTLQVRARRARDLDILRAEYMKGKLGPTIHTPSMDYEYRAYCTPESYAFAVARMIMEIDYLKFKPTTDRYEDNELHSMFNRIWSVVSTSLSTPAHRRYYNSTAAASTAARTVTTLNALDVGKTGVDLDKAVTGAGVGWADYADYYADPRYDLPDPTAAYSSSATRDTYEPEVWDRRPATGDAEVDAAYLRIDELETYLADTRPLDHSGCDHTASHNARARCRNKHRAAAIKELADLRDHVADQYRNYLENLSDVAESDDLVTVVGGSTTTTKPGESA